MITLTAVDFYCLLEMITTDITLTMSENTYREIIGATGSIENREEIHIEERINGINIIYDNNQPLSFVIIAVGYTPRTRDYLEAQIIA